MSRKTDDLRPEPWPLRGQLLIRPEHQATVWVLVVIAILAVAARYVWPLATGVGTVEIESASVRPAEFRVDINRADWPEFASLPGIGEHLAREIVTDRDRQGPFRSLADLERVAGIGPIRLQAIRPYLILRSPGLPGPVGE